MITDHPPYRLASLLHDVGKVRTRTDSERMRAGSTEGEVYPEHATVSAEFARSYIDDEAVPTLVEHHHEPVGSVAEDLQSDLLVLKAANRIATPSDEAEMTSQRLQSVFASLAEENEEDEEKRDTRHRLTEDESETPPTYPLAPLRIERDVLFPRDPDDHDRSIEEGYHTLWDGLTEVVTPNTGYETLVSLLETHTWCVPANVDTPGLPLYDYLRTTAALADALADVDPAALQAVVDGERSDTKLFTLVKGDISGIQDFIHRMRSPDEAQSRASKRLRGRSTQLWLLNEGLGRLFLDRLDLPVTSLVWSGGGQFYALVPPTKTATIDAFVEEVNGWLLERFDADLFFVSGTATSTDPDADFGRLFKQVANDTDENKLTKGSATIAALDSAVLGPPVEPCRLCGGEKSVSDDRCVECQIQEGIGQSLPTAEYVCLDHETRSDADFTLDLPNGGVSWRLRERPADAGLVYALNETTLPDVGDDAGFVFTGATVPFGGGVDRVWSFIEQQALGVGDTRFMHVAKMDIDSLGAAIADGMGGGPSRLAALSRALDVFFAGYANELADEMSFWHARPDACEECRDILDEGETRTVEHTDDEGNVIKEVEYSRPDADEIADLHDGDNDVDECVDAVSPIYIGFAGGDDMFFVGPWNEALDFGQQVRTEFAEYTGERLTVSGGFNLTQPTHPIGRAIETAETLLDSAKEFELEEDEENVGTEESEETEREAKNAATVFDTTLPWEYEADAGAGMESLLDTGQWLSCLIRDDEISRSFIHGLLAVRDEMYPNPVSPGDVPAEKPREWRLKYLLTRHLDDDEELLEKMEQDLPERMPWIDVAVSWASLETR